MEEEYALIFNPIEVAGLLISIVNRNEIRLKNRWAKYCYYPIEPLDIITLEKFDHSFDFDHEGQAIFLGTYKECLNMYSNFPKFNLNTRLGRRIYVIPAADINIDI